MKAITLRHPWPWAIAVLGKRIENRTWKPSSLGQGDMIAIHGGAMPDNRGLYSVGRIARELIARPGNREIIERVYGDRCELRDSIIQGIVGVATIDRFVTESDDPWFQGPIGWVFSDFTAFREPIPCKGAQGLWDVPDNVVNAMRSAYKQAKSS